MATLQEFEKQFILLCETGFIAVNQFDEDAAVKLFKAAQILSPHNTLPQIGFGYLHLCKLELRQAAEMFDSVLQKEPSNEMAKTFLGITLSFLPNELSKGEKILDQVARGAENAEIKTLADTALNFVDNFIKKSPSPVQPQTTKKKP